MRTEPFRVSRLAFAYLGVARYLRSYWWFAAIIPAFGLVALAFGAGILRAMGLMALLWPLSLPARAIFATSKAGRLMERGAWASLEDNVLYLHGEDGGLRIGLEFVRRIERTRGFLVLVLAREDFVALPLSALGDDFIRRAEVAVSTKSDANPGKLP